MINLLTLSGTELAKMIRHRMVTSREVVKAHIEHIKKVNPLLNAVVKDRFTEALKEANLADSKIRDYPIEALPPFYGVPCTIKEHFALKGMPNTSGLVHRKNNISITNATVVERLLSAGAIPLGVTNVSELGMWMESNNEVYGRTNNPYDRKRTAGGSSGGEGSIIASGGSPFGLGSDIGGSIRVPSFFNGIFGHKPTGGLVPNTGHYPTTEGKAIRFLTSGPMAKHAEDLWTILKIIAGDDGKDKGILNYTLRDPKEVRLKDLTVLNVTDNGLIPVSDELRFIQQKAIAALSHAGAKISNVQLADLKDSFFIWASMLSEAGGRSFKNMMGDGTDINVGLELTKWMLGFSNHTLPGILLSFVEDVPKLLPNITKEFVQKGENLKKEMKEIIGEHGVMLYPSYPEVAPPHNKPLANLYHWMYTAIFNVMENPVTQVPLGLNQLGLPLGIQVVGSHGNDHITIAVAMELEKAFGGWTPPKYLKYHI
ncbi:MAG: amidase [Leptospiraceae bacterium]|nr:amidase [Leptospiraceae bacterium]MCP5495656.1 amidase [Leptospiraceae bacterium]